MLDVLAHSNILKRMVSSLHYILLVIDETVFELFSYNLNQLRLHYTFHWRRQWHPTPVLLPGKSHGPEEPGRLQSMGLLRVRLRRDFTFTFHFHTLEKEMATHSSVLAWRIPGKGEPGRLLSMGSHRVGHNGSDLATAATPWRSSGQDSALSLPKLSISSLKWEVRSSAVG